jgi:hypothetical protein
MRQGEPDEGRLEIPRIDPGQRGERLEPGETPRVSLGLTQAECSAAQRARSSQGGRAPAQTPRSSRRKSRTVVGPQPGS